jgi:hypothetical protein
MNGPRLHGQRRPPPRRHQPADPRARRPAPARSHGPVTVPRTIDVDPDAADLGITGLRQGDVVSVETGDPQRDGDYLVDGVVNLREGAQVTVVAVMTDADRTRWLVGSPDQDRYLLCEPVRGHGLSGEPPRHILHDDQDYALERRGQSSAAGVGMHGRPALPRVATYVYRAGPDQALWLERWGDQVLMGAATSVSAHDVHFLPGLVTPASALLRPLRVHSDPGRHTDYPPVISRLRGHAPPGRNPRLRDPPAVPAAPPRKPCALAPPR